MHKALQMIIIAFAMMQARETIADDFPTHDIMSACRKLAGTDRGSEAVLGFCVGKEADALPIARERWEIASPAARRACRGATFYMGLADCIAVKTNDLRE